MKSSSDSELWAIGVDPGRYGAWSAITAGGTTGRPTIRMCAGFPVKTRQFEVFSEAKSEWAKREVIDSSGLFKALHAFRLNRPQMFVERVAAMPRQGTRSMFSFGESFGAVCAAAAICGYPFCYVTPKTWQAYFFGKARVKDTKRASLDVFIELFGDGGAALLDEVASPVRSGITDSALLAVFGLQEMRKPSWKERLL